MLLALGGDAHHQLHLVAVPVDAVGVGHDHHAGPFDEGLDVVGAVGDRHMTADGYGKTLLPVQHPLDIRLVHIAALHHTPSAGDNSLFGRDALTVQYDVLLLQQDAVRLNGSLRLLPLCRSGSALTGFQQLRHQHIILRRAHKILDRNDPGLRRPLSRPPGQLMVGDHDLAVGGNLGDGVMDDFNAGDPRVLELVSQHRRAHGGGAHARIAGKDDLLHVLGADGCPGAGLRRLSLGGGLAGGHLGLSLGQAGVLTEGLQQEHGDGEADRGGNADTGDVGEVAALGGHEQLGDDGAGGGRGHQAAAQDGQGEDTGDVARHGAQDDDGVHEHVREVDLVDAAHKLDDGGGAGGGAGLTLAGYAIGQQQAQSGAGVGLDHEQDGLAQLRGLFGADGGEDAVVDGVVEKEHLGGFHQHGGEGQQAVTDKEADAAAQHIGDDYTGRADDEDGQYSQDAAEDAHGEVVDHHLEAGGDMALHLLVKLLDAPAAQGAADHGADEHGAGGGGDGAQGSQSAGDGALLAAHGLAAGVADEDGQQIREHGADHGIDGGGRPPFAQPSVRDEQSGNQAPCNKGADVGHDHAAEETTEFLHMFFHEDSPCIIK